MASNNNQYKRLCTEENNVKGSTVKKEADEVFTPREYQIEILETAKQKNTIACLGTGTGKTFIAVMLIRECATDVYLDFEKGGKRIFFLVPTVPLVHQQQRTIEHHTSFKVKGYSGDMQVDSWNKEKWTAEFKDTQVLVMTAEIFRIIVDHSFIPLERIQLIVIDECHRAQGDHPYRQAMKCFISRPKEEMPRVFGLSASLINGKCKPSQLEKQLRDLEKTLFSSITTVSDIIDLQKYGADPDEFLVYYKPYSIKTNLLEKIYKMKNDINREKTNFGRGSEYVLDTDIIFFDKPLRCLNSLQVTLEKLGPWCALKAADIFSEELGTVLLKNSNGMLTPAQTEVLNNLMEFIKIFKEECAALDLQINQESDQKWPNKLQRLLEVFNAIKRSTKFCDVSESLNSQVCPNLKDDPEEYFNFLKSRESASKSDVKICAIIFVEQRITAYVLQKWILEVKERFPELDFLVPEFVVGHGTNGARRTCMSEKQQKKALEDFRKKKCNVLISTCVLEEGMDVQQCNVVIRFDLPADFRGYVQSKGRARAKNSIYVLMSEFNETDKSKFWIDMVNFKTVEKMLLSKCHDRTQPEEEEIKEHMADSLLPPYMPHGPKGPRITMISAISVINRYCARLPCDMATKLTAKWYLKIVDADAPEKQYECTLKMPINSPLRKPITGERMRQKKAAKMAAALKACQQLDEIGELNEHLVPISCLVDQAVLDEIGEEEEEEDGDGAIPGTNRRRQIYPKHVPIFLQNSLPKPMLPCYLYALEMDLVEPLPDCLNPRNRPILNPAASERGLALLLTKKLPMINSFPVFTKSGKLKVKISLNGNEFQFSANQLDSIAKFHQFVFSEALRLGENKSFEPDVAVYSFFIVPTKKGSKSSKLTIDWQFISDTEQHPYHDFDASKALDTTLSEESYKDKVLLKTYIQSEKPTFHHTIKVLNDMSPCSMLSSDLTFKQYYKGKYNVTIKYEEQSLVETYQDAILHRWKPLYLNSKQALNDITTPLSKTKQRHRDYREYLVPELCIIHPFPSTFYQKVLCLPTILFRLNSLLLAEELRRQVATSGLIGTVEPNVLEWPHFSLETSDKELKKYLVEKRKIALLPECTFVPQDVVKCGALIDSFVRKIDDLPSHPGPSPSLILQALTSKSTGDEFDLERLEMIGDSFLKYAMSIKIYLKYNNFDEGKLTRLRSRLIQNLNLYKLAKKKNLPEFLICSTFSCKSSWLPPCYTIEEEEVKISNKNSKAKREEGEEQQKFTFFKKQIISDKCIADSVEALIGAYLLSCGQKGALMFMFWLGLNPFPEKTDVSRCDFENWPPEPPSPIINNLPNMDAVIQKLCYGFGDFEKSIGYRFNDCALLLQAFTHPSYIYNEITDCYQRLEFLGDAVLDFLITRQLYEDPNDHSPGKLTDLRSALVNNIYFASLAVKYKYNVHLKMLSPHLFRLLQHYLDIYEKSSAYEFFEKHGYLEEIECFELDEVEVPKALGDLFESVAGAIFLDSGMSLDTVWKVVYPMIKPAMDHLTKHVPMSPVRELYEILKRKDIFNETKKDEKSYVEVILDTGEKVVGVGPNKKVAKRSAAKRALAILKGITE